MSGPYLAEAEAEASSHYFLFPGGGGSGVVPSRLDIVSSVVLRFSTCSRSSRLSSCVSVLTRSPMSGRPGRSTSEEALDAVDRSAAAARGRDRKVRLLTSDKRKKSLLVGEQTTQNEQDGFETVFK